jgi:hypothetical protein
MHAGDVTAVKDFQTEELPERASIWLLARIVRSLCRIVMVLWNERESAHQSRAAHGDPFI